MTEHRARYLDRHADRPHFVLGDEAVAWGAVYAGCDFFGAYPITPASEVGELLARMLPDVGGFFVQMEDELAALASVIGAVWTGARGMTATSGPGFSLMQEHIGYAMMTETPCVIVDVQRSGPSTGQATMPAQSDFLQARWGTHGDHETLAVSPWSVQECFDLTIDAFNLAEEYRHPVIVLMDGEVGHIRERLVTPRFDAVVRAERRRAAPGQPAFGGEPVPGMHLFGDGRFVHVTGSTHKPTGLRDASTPATHDTLVRRLVSKIADRRASLVRVHEVGVDDAEVVVVAYGITARSAYGAVRQLRAAGLPVGMIRPQVVWPFPGDRIREVSTRLRAILVPELSLGQLDREVARYARCDVHALHKIGGELITVDQVVAAVRAVFDGKGRTR